MSEITKLRSGQGTTHTTVSQSLLQFTPSQNETLNKDVCNPARVLGAVMDIFLPLRPAYQLGSLVRDRMTRSTIITMSFQSLVKANIEFLTRKKMFL